MAHFFNPLRPYDEHYVEGRPAFVGLSGELKIGLWTGDASLMSKMVVTSTDATASVRDVAAPFADTPDVQYYTVTGIREGTTKIEARAGSGGPLWAWMPLNVGRFPLPGMPGSEKPDDPQSHAERLVRVLFASNRITFHEYSGGGKKFFTQALAHEKVGGQVASLKLPLLLAIIALTEVAPLKLLRAFAAPDQGPHTSGKAMDISAWGAFTFDDHQAKAHLIEGVSNLIRVVPADIKFNLGLVRPVGGVGGFDPSRDVFFTVGAENVTMPPTEGVPNACKPGKGWGFGMLLPDAKRAIDSARAGKNVNYCYPDGHDHVHFEVV